jgi:hypothetical protein
MKKYGMPSSNELSPEPTVNRIETMRNVRAVRDARERELLDLLAGHEKVQTLWAAAWFKLRDAQGELDQLVEAEILRHIEL